MTTTLDRDWMVHAACRGTDQPEVFFPDPGMVCVDARLICAGCPVVETCLQYALDTRQMAGVWGGTTPVERQRMLVPRRFRDAP